MSDAGSLYGSSGDAYGSPSAYSAPSSADSYDSYAPQPAYGSGDPYEGAGGDYRKKK